MDSFKKKMMEAPPLPWRQQVQKAAMNFAGATHTNFSVGLKHVRDKVIPLPENYPEAGQIFSQALLGVTVGILANTFIPSAEFEEEIVKEIRAKFEYIRKDQIEKKLSATPAELANVQAGEAKL